MNFPPRSFGRDQEMMEEIGTLPDGTTIFREPNKCGGYTYWSDEIGGGVFVWDTCLVSIKTLEFVLKYEKDVKNG